MHKERKGKGDYFLQNMLIMVTFCVVFLVLIGAASAADTESRSKDVSDTEEQLTSTLNKVMPPHCVRWQVGRHKKIAYSDSGSFTEDRSANVEDADAATGTLSLEIDNETCYEGMDKSYSEGYIPVVTEGQARLVLPLLCRNGSLSDNKVSVTLNLGEPSSMPFINKNYNKTIFMEKVPMEGGQTKEVYLIRAALDLKEGRVNGSYPVMVIVSATALNGTPVEAVYTIYVNITDGIDPNAEPTTEATTEAPVTYAPKIMIEACEVRKVDAGSGGNALEEDEKDKLSNWNSEKGVLEGNAEKQSPEGNGVLEESAEMQSPEGNGEDRLLNQNGMGSETIYAGDTITVTVRLRNSSQTESVENMTATVSAAGEYFSVLSASDSVYLGSLPAGEVAELTLQYRVNPATPQGQYNLSINLDYADQRGGSYGSSGNAKLNISQPVSVAFDPIQMVTEAKVADTIEATVQAMNLGRARVYNVRAAIEGDGLRPKGTIFIGDMEAGEARSASTTIDVSSLSGGTALYGTTTAVITYIYEDESGTEYEKTEELRFTIQSPFSNISVEEEAEPERWWQVMAVILGILCIIGGYLLVRTLLRKRKLRVEEADIHAD